MSEREIFKLFVYAAFFISILITIRDCYLSKNRKKDKYRKKLGNFIMPSSEELILSSVFTFSFVGMTAIL